MIEDLNFLLEMLDKRGNEINGVIDKTPYTEQLSELFAKIKLVVKQCESDMKEEEWLFRNIRILEQFVDKNYLLRDQLMAENGAWIANQDTASKLVLCAHNEHVKKAEETMGGYLADAFNEDYLTVGFTFHKGTYSAVGNKEKGPYTAQESYLGTFEYFFQALEEPIFLLDLGGLQEDSSEHGQWLKEMLDFRIIGVKNVRQEFCPTNLLESYDMIIFINKSSYSRLTIDQ